MKWAADLAFGAMFLALAALSILCIAAVITLASTGRGRCEHEYIRY